MKELLGEELFNQVKEKIGDKELILNDGAYIPKRKFDDLNEDKKALEKQLGEANTKITELSSVDAEELKREIEDWKSKYEADTKSLNEKISKREYEYKVNDLVRDIKFSSESAKKMFVRDLADKELKLENGELLGFNDYLNSYKKSDPGAFSENKNPGDDIDLGGNFNEKRDVDLNSMSYEEYKKWREKN